MAPIDRQTWAELRTRLMRGLGRYNLTSFEDRAGEFLAAALYELATTFHHHELDAVDTSLTLSVGSRELALPADCWGIFSFTIRNPGNGAWIRTLTWEEAHSVDKSYVDTNAEPKRYSRYKDDLILPAPSDQAYQTTLRYYRIPTAPDFATGSPELGRWWDEIILAQARMIGFYELWRPDLADMVDKRIQKFLELTPQPLLKDVPLFGAPEIPVRNRPHGGARG